MKKLLIFLCMLPIVVGGQTPHRNGLYKVKFPEIPGASFRLKKAFVEDDSANVWIGFDYVGSQEGSVGLGKFKNGSWTTYRTANSGIISNNITELCAGDSADILIGTRKGLSIFNRKHNSWRNYTSSNTPLPSNYITSIARSGAAIWIGTDKGIVKWEQGMMTVFNGQNWGTGSDWVTHITISGNTVFAGTKEGLVQFKNGTWSLFKYQGADFPINRLCMAPHNVLYLYGDSGLYTFTSGSIQPVQINLECLSLEMSDLKGGTALTVDPDGSVYFIPKQNPGNMNASQDLFVYQIKNGEVKELAYLDYRGGWHAFLGTGASGNIWVLDAVSYDSIFYIKPGEYIEALHPMLSIGQNFHKLDINKMNLGIHNSGDMYWNLHDRPVMEVPKGSCKNAAFSASLWVGGMDTGQNIYVAAMTYRQAGADFFPGPIDTVSGKGSKEANNPYDRIWKINRQEIVEFKAAFANGAVSNGTYIPSPDFLQWPAHGTGNYSRTLAPFVDVNNDGKYNPFDGDYPQIKGDQMLFWIFNDNANIHSETGGWPFGIEVHASAYAFNCTNIQDGDSDEVLNYSSFYHYKIINRSGMDYSNMYYGKWFDVDLGNFWDDRVGCNPEGSYMYGYNGDNDDEGNQGYGENPPMINVLWLNDTMEHFVYYANDFSITGNPQAKEHYYLYMAGIWKDGTPITEGGMGHQSGAPTNFMFPGNPYDTSEWNESSANLGKGDRRMLSSVRDDLLPAGGVKELEYAVIYTREPNAPNGLNTSWAKNTADINQIKYWYSTNSFPTCDGVGSSIGDELEKAEQLSLYPNPGTNTFSIQLAGQQLEGAEIRVVGITGRLVYETVNTNGIIDASAWKAGFYFIRVVSGGVSYSAKWVKVE